MADLKFDTSKPSHIIGGVALVGFVAFLIGQLITDADVLATTTLKALALGSVYALIALGFVLIFKATEVVNFSQGALAMIGALFISFMVAPAVGPYQIWIAIALIMLLAIPSTYLIEKPLARWIRRKYIDRGESG